MKNFKILFSVALAIVFSFSACNKDQTESSGEFAGGVKSTSKDCPLQWDCSEATNFTTFLKKQGNDKGTPESNKVGDLSFVATSNELIITLTSLNGAAVKDAGVLWAITKFDANGDLDLQETLKDYND